MHEGELFDHFLGNRAIEPVEAHPATHAQLMREESNARRGRPRSS